MGAALPREVAAQLAKRGGGLQTGGGGGRERGLGKCEGRGGVAGGGKGFGKWVLEGPAGKAEGAGEQVKLVKLMCHPVSSIHCISFRRKLRTNNGEVLLYRYCVRPFPNPHVVVPHYRSASCIRRFTWLPCC